LSAGAAIERRLPSTSQGARRLVRQTSRPAQRRRAPVARQRAGRVQVTLSRKLVAEALGTALLLATVVGSGIMGDALAGGNVAIALLANALATGAALAALILTFGPISGAHFNPAVTLADASQGGLAWREVPSYLIAQIAGAFVGVAFANIMFELPVFFRHYRD